jgi:hypothetical protein
MGFFLCDMYSMGHNKNKSKHMKENGLTRKDLVRVTGVPHYKIDYLRELGRLKLIKESPKQGIPVVYHPECIGIIKQYSNR